jgi:hypothetical protein
MKLPEIQAPWANYVSVVASGSAHLSIRSAARDR